MDVELGRVLSRVRSFFQESNSVPYREHRGTFFSGLLRDLKTLSELITNIEELGDEVKN